MSKKIKVLLSSAGFIIAAIALSVSYFYSTQTPLSSKDETDPPVNEAEEIEPENVAEAATEAETNEKDQIVKDYVEEKYGFEIDIIKDEAAQRGTPGDVVVSPKDNKDIRFLVIVHPTDHPSEYTVVEDDYLFALEADKEYQKLKAVLPAIGELGFTDAVSSDIRINYNHDSLYLFLENITDASFENFEEKELDRYYELYRLIKTSGAKIRSYTVVNGTLHDSITLYWDPSAKLHNKEEFSILLKKDNRDIINQEMESQFVTEVTNLNNDRFNFGNPYNSTTDNPFDSWFHCIELNENAECTSAVISLAYQEDSLNASNPYLKEDLTSIFDFIATHLEPETKVESVYIDGRGQSLEKLEIGYEERMQYKNVDELIAFLLNE